MCFLYAGSSCEFRPGGLMGQATWERGSLSDEGQRSYIVAC